MRRGLVVLSGGRNTGVCVFLFALFTIASGLAFLETAANLYVTVLGDKKDAEWRINFAQSFNGISIILGPVIGSLFIFSKTEYTPELLAQMTAEQIESARVDAALSVQAPYLMVAAVVLLVAVLFAVTKMPEVGREEELAEGKVSVFELVFPAMSSVAACWRSCCNV
ncbi:MAG: hypothetical protein R2792_15105 [Saprospiraceae bacterium]